MRSSELKSRVREWGLSDPSAVEKILRAIYAKKHDLRKHKTLIWRLGWSHLGGQYSSAQAAYAYHFSRHIQAQNTAVAAVISLVEKKLHVSLSSRNMRVIEREVKRLVATNADKVVLREIVKEVAGRKIIFQGSKTRDYKGSTIFTVTGKYEGAKICAYRRSETMFVRPWQETQVLFSLMDITARDFVDRFSKYELFNAQTVLGVAD